MSASLPFNQIIYVKNVTGLKVEQIWEPVWLTGNLKARSVSSVLADVGYTLVDGTVNPYEDFPENVKEAH